MDLRTLLLAVGQEGRLERVIEEGVNQARAVTAADGASLLLLDGATGELVFSVTSDDSEGRLVEVRLPPGEGVAWRALRERRTIQVAAAGDEPEFPKTSAAAPAFATGPLLAIPLLVAGEPLGVIEAVRARGAAAFTAEDVTNLERLAEYLSLALHDATVVGALRKQEEAVRRANTDLEERIRSRTAALARGKREWELTFDAIEQPIALQRGFVLRRINHQYGVVTERPLPELVGRRCFEVLAARDSPCEGCPLRAEGGERLTARGLSFPSGRVMDVSGFYVPAEDGARNAVLVYRDVTSERRLEEQLRQSERMASLGQLASGAAHEINNPLGFIGSNLSTLSSWLPQLEGLRGALVAAVPLLEEGRPAEAEGLLRRAVEDAPADLFEETRALVAESRSGLERISQIVSSLRELSPLLRSRVEPVDVNDSVRRIARSAGRTAGPELSLEARARVLAAPVSLDHALSHVMKNACQAAGDGGVIRIRTFEDGEHVHIAVADAGSGIPAEHLPRVFEPFFTTRKLGEGLGLGLTATFGIVKRFGGDVDVRSRVGEGTTVTLKLPKALAVAR